MFIDLLRQGRSKPWPAKLPSVPWRGASNCFVVTGSKRPYLVIAAQESRGVGAITIVTDMNNPCAGVGAAWRNRVHVKDHPGASLRNARSAPFGELDHFRLGVEMRCHR